MAAPKSDPIYYYHYQPMPAHPDPTAQTVVLLRPYIRAPRRGCPWRLPVAFTAAVILLAAAAYVLWPSDPDLEIVRLKLARMRVHTSPRIALDIAMALTVKIRNRDLYSFDYHSLDVAIGYRGKKLGHVSSEDGHVKARAASYADVELDFNGLEVLSDVLFLLEDLAKGSIPFDTVTKVEGQLGLFFLQLPLKAKLSCEIHVNTTNQAIIQQSCYPE